MNGISLRVAVAAASAALVLVACAAGTDTNGPQTTNGPETTNGLETKSAAEVQQQATAALRRATSVHVTMTGADESRRPDGDLRIQGTSSSGIIRQKGTRLEVIKIGEDVYFKGDQQALAAFGLPAELQQLAADRWLKFPQKMKFPMTGFSVDDLAAELTGLASPLQPTVEQTTLNGRKVVVISHQNGTRLYVANIGVPYPLRAKLTEAGGRQTDFTDYGADFKITAPPNAFDISTIIEPGR